MEDGFYRAAVEFSPTAMLVLDPAGRVRYANERARALLLVPDVAGRGFEAMFTAGDAARAAGYMAGLARNPTSPSTFFTGELAAVEGGPVRFVHVYGRRLQVPADPEVVLLLTVVDRTEARAREAELEHNALHDALTGLANRVLLTERLQHASADPAAPAAIMLIDLDGFKEVNDRLGHPAGDRVLVEVARRLRAALPPSATIARLGGDEFAVLVPETDRESAAKLANVVLDAIAEPFLGGRASLGASVGVSDVADEQTGLRQADLAMYAAKAAGRHCAVVYSADVEESMRTRSRRSPTLTELQAERDRLHAEARTDPLTGLANRRALDEYMAGDQAAPVSVLFIDIDRFSSYNHRHGDQQGDRALRTVAHTIEAACRSTDRLFRKGGEEFVVVLPGADDTAARAAAERIRTAVERVQLAHGGTETTPVVTVTVGAATHPHGDVGRALDAASNLAYDAKVAGFRNSVATG